MSLFNIFIIMSDTFHYKLITENTHIFFLNDTYG